MCCFNHLKYPGGSCWPSTTVDFCWGALLNPGLEVQCYVHDEVTNFKQLVWVRVGLKPIVVLLSSLSGCVKEEGYILNHPQACCCLGGYYMGIMGKHGFWKWVVAELLFGLESCASHLMTFFPVPSLSLLSSKCHLYLHFLTVTPKFC